jgi:hypothetical protein
MEALFDEGVTQFNHSQLPPLTRITAVWDLAKKEKISATKSGKYRLNKPNKCTK